MGQHKARKGRIRHFKSSEGRMHNTSQPGERIGNANQERLG